jgi:hypothetical protein
VDETLERPHPSNKREEKLMSRSNEEVMPSVFQKSVLITEEEVRQFEEDLAQVDVPFCFENATEEERREVEEMIIQGTFEGASRCTLPGDTPGDSSQT